jgi:NADH dehydrogenase
MTGAVHPLTLIVGASSRLGQVVVRQLLADGSRVRALTRAPAKLGMLRSLGAEVVQGDLRDRASLVAACRGVQRVLAATHSFFGHGPTGPSVVDRAGNMGLIDAACAAGVEHFVFTSVHGVRPDHPVDVFQIKHEVEDYLRACGLRWTILRPSAFMETLPAWQGDLILKRGVALILGDATQPVNFVTVQDVARYAVWALSDPGAAGQVVEIGGPENLTADQVVRVFTGLRGRPAVRIRIPVRLLRALAWCGRPFCSELSRRFATLFTHPEPVDASLPAAAHRFPQTRLEDWARDYFGKMQSSGRFPGTLAEELCHAR